MKHLTLVDLEGTLIEDWYNHTLINEDKVEAFFEWQRELSGLDAGAILPVELFSFAIFGDDSWDMFNYELCGVLEKRYNIRFSHVHTVPSIIKEVEYFMGTRFESQVEATSRFGKGRMFMEYAQAASMTRKFDVITLLDDSVQTCEFNLFKRDKMIRMIRVDDIGE